MFNLDDNDFTRAKICTRKIKKRIYKFANLDGPENPKLNYKFIEYGFYQSCHLNNKKPSYLM